MKGVILAINPQATLVDITHMVTPYDVMAGALMIGGSFSVFPVGTVHLAVVDPGVGSSRRPIVVVTKDYFFVGPDNGIFSCVYRQAGGAFEVYHATTTDYFRKCVHDAGGSAAIGRTFHGRDVFAPICAHLGNGLDPKSLGHRIDDFITLDIPVPTVNVSSGSVIGQIIYIDHFGNCITNIDEVTINTALRGISPREVRIVFGDTELPFTGCYQEAGHMQLSALINSSGALELFVNQANASRLFDISVGQLVISNWT
ncbi:protein containing DUF62 [Candidatus Magnetobacterium bavaricum]|uniref:Protein containing DUF62 n=1 Tax=Candidatus Magnetobacterium bavaricum TaxID=29290 RepID=A0A0F3H149_9BACT|nr:protein containing DUF62 [Candidatus Magnetobacterium bavaricum]